MITKEYIAGLFDGEGTVWVSHKHKNKRGYIRADVNITNTYREVLEIIKLMYGGCILQKKYGEDKKHYKPCFVWTTSCKKALKFLIDIEPFSIIKRDKIKIAIEIQKLVSLKKSGYKRREDFSFLDTKDKAERNRLYTLFKDKK
jgi:intein-encoded DNA endonuclease-like protein